MKLSDILTSFKTRVVSLDLSYNNLSEKSLPKLKEFAMDHPELKTINLSNNNIKAGMQYLLDLANTLEHIIVCDNPVVSRIYHSTHLPKSLIFIPHHWLHNRVWKKLKLQLNDNEEKVYKVHNEFYNNILKATNWTQMPNIEYAGNDIAPHHISSSNTHKLLNQLKEKPKDRRSAKIIAAFYQDGYTFKKNYLKSARWWSYAAYLGDAEAMYHLGQLFETGEGIMFDDKKGENFKTQAISAGYTPDE